MILEVKNPLSQILHIYIVLPAGPGGQLLAGAIVKVVDPILGIKSGLMLLGNKVAFAGIGFIGQVAAQGVGDDISVGADDIIGSVFIVRSLGIDIPAHVCAFVDNPAGEIGLQLSLGVDGAVVGLAGLGIILELDIGVAVLEAPGIGQLVVMVDFGGVEDSSAEEEAGEVSGVGVEEVSGIEEEVSSAEEEVSGAEEEASGTGETETLLEAGSFSVFSPQAVRLSSSTAARRIDRVFFIALSSPFL